MTLEEAKELACKGIKVTHTYFITGEWMIIENGVAIFEDEGRILFDEWVKGKEYLKYGWSIYNDGVYAV